MGNVYVFVVQDGQLYSNGCGPLQADLYLCTDSLPVYLELPDQKHTVEADIPGGIYVVPPSDEPTVWQARPVDELPPDRLKIQPPTVVTADHRSLDDDWQ